MLNEERAATNRYFEKDGQLLTKDVFSSPRTMIRQASFVTPGMVYGYGVIVNKSQLIKDAASRVAEDKLFGQIQRQQQLIGWLHFLSPALMMQEVLAALAGTHWQQFNQFSHDVDAFRVRTQQFFYPKMATQQTYRTSTVRDADAIPGFAPRTYADYGWLPIGWLLLTYLTLVAGLLIVGYQRITYASR
ncbi:uncharacterized protein DUF3526 [Spirosoma oryzae]|uniref:Uncharacterized protein DUF3526 n=1 Tax=Spirosoma oryzae TaxID=1469603 RepID=A0A2T0SAF7_9BACT|nr:DUF3526 domain-containing protein [Spirosoma oryzae]PRY30407.1 uncharacterized protein DUF3526 [Spirosoma oryzae]